VPLKMIGGWFNTMPEVRESLAIIKEKHIQVGTDDKGVNMVALNVFMQCTHSSCNGNPLVDGRLTVRFMRRVDWTC
jgi:hypothetical protein